MKKKILAVDDEIPILEILQEVLRKGGYEVFTSSRPTEAFVILQEQEIDLVLLDIHMPGKNGFALYKELEGKNIPVLFVTGHPESFNRESDELTLLWQNQFAVGTTDVLYKPFSIDALYEKVEGLIGPAHEEEEVEEAE
jgi:DNA-binding response OmpR family regulator